MRATVVSLDRLGLILKRRRGGVWTVAYGDVMTAERLASGRGLRLHTRLAREIALPCRGDARVALEGELRKRGIRIVDGHGAMITPTLEDFENELTHEPI